MTNDPLPQLIADALDDVGTARARLRCHDQEPDADVFDLLDHAEDCLREARREAERRTLERAG